MEQTFGSLDIADLWIPFYCVSTNLTQCRAQIHDRGPLVQALRATASIPGVLPPVSFDGDLLVDGGCWTTCRSGRCGAGTRAAP